MDFISYLQRLKIIPLLKKWNLLNIILAITDVLVIALAFQCSYYINYFYIGGFFFTERNLLYLFLGLLPFWLLVLYLIKVTEIPRTKRYRALLYEYFQSALAIAVLLLILYFVFRMHWISRLFLIELTFLGFIFLFIVRVLEYKVFKAYRARGYNYRNIALIADESSLPFIEKLLSTKVWGYRIAAIFSSSPKLKEKYEETIIMLPQEYLMVLSDLMEVNIIDEVLYLKTKVVPSEIRTVIRSCEELGVVFRLKYENNKINLTSAIKTYIGNEKFLNFINIPHNPYSMEIKKFMDLAISFFSLIFLSPVFLAIAIAVKRSSPGPIIFKQVRVGLRGRQFKLYKFRTMIENAEILRKELEDENEVDGPVFKIKDDPRVTKVGQFLRRTGLDELPQLINILKGEMSLIGPRPPLEKEIREYKRWQLRRLSVKPGLSCFWQVRPERNNIKFEKWMEMDLAYIDNWSLRLDFMIFIKTIKTIFQRSGW